MTSSYQRELPHTTTFLPNKQEDKRQRPSIYNARRTISVVFLTLGLVCISLVVVSSMRQALPYAHMAMIPIEMEGWPLRSSSGETDHETLKGGCEATVIIMRHCEKGDMKKHCDYLGLERSVYLATLFGDGDERWPAPSYIFAEGPGGRHNTMKRNYREIETAGPLSRKTGVQVDASYNTNSRGELVDHVGRLLKSGDLCGKVAVIVWKHSDIGHLAHKLGCSIEEGCPMDYKGKDFDVIWQLRYVYNFELATGKVHYRRGRHPKTWRVFGTVLAENFDPLAFSKQQGDYPRGGRFGGSQWVPDADVLTEETVTKLGDNWDEVKPSFVMD